jgi:hypothetical protein
MDARSEGQAGICSLIHNPRLSGSRAGDLSARPCNLGLTRWLAGTTIIYTDPPQRIQVSSAALGPHPAGRGGAWIPSSMSPFGLRRVATSTGKLRPPASRSIPSCIWCLPPRKTRTTSGGMTFRTSTTVVVHRASSCVRCVRAPPVWRDQLHVSLGQFCIQSVRPVGVVADETRGERPDESLCEGRAQQRHVMRRGALNVHGPVAIRLLGRPPKPVARSALPATNRPRARNIL